MLGKHSIDLATSSAPQPCALYEQSYKQEGIRDVVVKGSFMFKGLESVVQAGLSRGCIFRDYHSTCTHSLSG